MPDRIETEQLPEEAGISEYVLPASLAQRRLWVLHQLDATGAAYNMPLALWLDGSLDRDRLLAALRCIAARHETLRTRFGIEADLPVQIVSETPALAVTCRKVPDDVAALRLARIAAGERFDLAAGPLWRLLLVGVRADRHLLLITLHHSVCDGWSIALLADELCRFYADLAAELPRLTLQYADYAAWQTGRITGPDGEALIERCRRRLDGAPQVLNLPTDHKRSATRSAAGGSVRFVLPPATSARLRALALAHNATPMMLHAAIFAALLGRWCNQTQLVLGVPVAGRDRSEVEPIIGLFVNVVVLPCDLRGDPDLGTLVGRVRETMLAALADQALPFERLVEALRPARTVGQNPLFQVLFSFQNLPPAQLQLAGLQVTPCDLGPAAPQFDLAASLTEEARTVLARIDYDAALFEHDSIVGLAERWQLLAAATAADPARPLDSLPLMSAADEAQRIAAAPESTPIPPWCVHDVILDRARREPRRVCVTGDDGSLDGAALDAAVASVAGRLAACGIGRGDRVGVYLTRGTRLVVGLLGVLAAGAAYVPLDPLYPRTRMAEILGKAGARAVVTERGLAADLVGPALVILDEPGPVAPVVARAGPADLAYVIFTSGSTGAPKGVAIGHRALINLLASMVRAPGCGSSDVWLATTTVSFDIAGVELYLPLLTGARLVIAGAATAADGEALGKAFKAHGATIMQATPSGWRLLLAAGWEGRAGLTALCGGEALPGDLALQLCSRTKEVWNLYGPTETTIWSAAERVGPGSPEMVPIGGPIANTRIEVLDRRMRPVPVGAIGEICIAGDGLGWGYIGRPDLTAERFIANPFGPPGSRLYRTGDLGRRRRDGTIDFLGRNDQQVKLRGYRVELGEIAAALRRLNGVADAVVALRGTGETAELVAWVVCADTPLDGAALRSALAFHVPRYMIPTHFVSVSALPLLPNGKLDRSRLPEPEMGCADAIAPRSPAEAAMLAIWQDVLGRRGFGVDDDFFALGGHSLLAARLVSTIRERVRAKIGLRELFLNPTVARLAAALTAPPLDQGSPLLRLAAGPLAAGRSPLLVVPGAGGSPLYLRPLAIALANERPVWGYEAIGSDGNRDPLGTIEEVAETYLAAARGHGLGPPWLFAGHSFGSRVAYEMARQAEAVGEVVRALIVLDTAAPVLDANPFAGVANDEAKIMVEVLGAIEVFLHGNLAVDMATFSAMPATERLDCLRKRLRAAGWPSGEVAARSLCNVYGAALRTHYRAPGRIDAPLLLVQAAAPLPMPAAIPALEALFNRPFWGWEHLVAPDRITLASSDGDHITLLSGLHAAGLAARLSSWLAECDRDASHPSSTVRFTK
jgi:amino acid adenylation domain-containing protein